MPSLPSAAPLPAAPRCIPRFADPAPLHARFDGPPPARARAAAAFGAQCDFELARARANVGFFKGHVRASLARLRRARRALGDPTLPLAEAARLEARLAAAVADLHFGLRQFRAQNRHYWRQFRQRPARQGGKVDRPAADAPRVPAVVEGKGKGEEAFTRRAAPPRPADIASPAAPLPAPPPLPPSAPPPQPWSEPVPPTPVTPEQRLLRRPTHTVDDGTRFWLFATRAEADAFAAARARRHAGRVYTLSELGTLGVFGRRAGA